MREAAEAAAKLLRSLRRELKVRVELLGPATSPLAKIRGRHRLQILLKSAARRDLHRLAAAWKSAFKAPSGVRGQVDVDPVDML